MKTHLHVHDIDDYSNRIDIFVNYLEDGKLRVPTGIATSSLEFQWAGVEKQFFRDIPIIVPSHSTEYLSFYYGPDWATPRTGLAWSWRTETRRAWNEMCLTNEQVSIIDQTRPNLGPRPECEKR
jgi:hypothetical protein